MKSKVRGSPWGIVVDWNLAPWLGKHPHVEGNYCKMKCFVAKAVCEAWILLMQLSPQPHIQGTIACVIVKC